MGRLLAAFVPLSAVAIAVVAMLAGTAAPTTACTGGGGPSGLEEAAHLPLIFLADAVRVDDAVNRAPAATPTTTPTSTPTATETVPAAASTAVSPPYATPTRPRYAGSAGVDLTGVGAELRVVRSYAGAPPAQLHIDGRARTELERLLRQVEAVGPISNCTPDRFVARYVPGRRYLVFATGVAPADVATAILFPVEGGSLILHDPLLGQSFLGELLMGATIYRRYFSGIATYEGQYGIAADRVPLSSVLRAIAALRGDVSIAPPETGSAGLAARR